MNLYIRLLLCILKSIRAPRMDILDKSVLRFHVLPTDLDFNMHMNNGRYLTIMDLGRLDVMIRTGLIKRVTDKSHAPVVGSAKIRFRLPLLPFQAYDLETQIQATLAELRETAQAVRILPPSVVPWYPENLKDLDIAVADCIEALLAQYCSGISIKSN